MLLDASFRVHNDIAPQFQRTSSIARYYSTCTDIISEVSEAPDKQKVAPSRTLVWSGLVSAGKITAFEILGRANPHQNNSGPVHWIT